MENFQQSHIAHNTLHGRKCFLLPLVGRSQHRFTSWLKNQSYIVRFLFFICFCLFILGGGSLDEDGEGVDFSLVVGC